MSLIARIGRYSRRNYNVAIVGSGPAGFYTAHHLLHRNTGEPLKIDFFDRLPAPYGLSRYGVAPDHPEVKYCQEYMDDIMADYGDHVRFFGNVNVGHDISLLQLQKAYHLVVLAYGCTAADNSLAVPGAELPGVVSARQIVNWYNCHPDAETAPVPPLETVEDVTIIGNGNVAIDVARVLLADPTAHWAKTDILAAAVEVLRRSAVKRVNIVARRGLLQAAFTNKELRELLQLKGVRFVPVADEIMDEVVGEKLGRVEKRRVALLAKANEVDTEANTEKAWALEFLRSPVRFVAGADGRVAETVFEQNELEVEHGRAKVRGTGRTVRTKNQMVVLSIGYQGGALPGFDQVGLLFDGVHNCLAHRGGRMVDTSGAEIPGWYALGWARTGPRGVIASTMMEAFDTADKVLKDLGRGVRHPVEEGANGDVVAALPHRVDWAGWGRIDRFEVEQGAREGKPRAKILRAEDMVAVAHQITV